jgi:hypothetical protein
MPPEPAVNNPPREKSGLVCGRARRITILRYVFGPTRAYQTDQPSRSASHRAPGEQRCCTSSCRAHIRAPLTGRFISGHSTITLTLDTYSHVVPGMQERAAERLDSLLDESKAAVAESFRADEASKASALTRATAAAKSQPRLLLVPRVEGRALRAGSRSSA